MNELEITQPEENLESTEAVESAEAAEEQALQDATHEPGARIEETQTFEQAEAVETALVEAVENADMDAVGELPVPLPQPAMEDDGEGGRQNVAIDPTPIWNTPDLSPGVDGNIVHGIAETNDPPDPKGPNLEAGLSPGIDSNVAETPDDPKPPGPNTELTPDDVKKQGSDPGLSPGVDGNVAQNHEPGAPSSGPNVEGQESV